MLPPSLRVLRCVSRLPYALPMLLTLPALGLALTYSLAGQGPAGLDFPDGAGTVRTIDVNGPIDLNNPFFQVLGSNGRSCVTCHQPSDAWSITPSHLAQRFNATGGTDPIFRLVDGANSPDADVSTVDARRRAYSMLLSRGVIRVGIGIPPNAEFQLDSVDDPYGFATDQQLSLFRRPAPSTNLPFLSAVMWDGRETVQKMSIQPLGGTEQSNITARLFDLRHQAEDATTGHAQADEDLTDLQKRQIVGFETGLFTAQSADRDAGELEEGGGGPGGLLSMPFYIGINDNVADPQGPFNPQAMTLYGSFAHSNNNARRAIALGEELFNTKPIHIRGVKGLNDNPYFGSPKEVVGTCTTCHNTPGVGNHSLSVPLDIGLTGESRRTPDMPLYTLRNRVTGEIVRTTDPGRALISGKWADIGKFKGPILRGLAARPPYFHNGSAATLDDVVDFYDTRFGVGFTAQEKRNLVAFLKSL